MIIGFSGSMGAGKSTAVKVLRQRFNPGQVKLVKFADPLYDIQEYIYDRIKSVYEPGSGFLKDRKLLQWIGTEWGRSTISEDLWVDLWKAEASRLIAKNYAVVACDDVRFDNEALTIKSEGGYIIRVTSDKSSERLTGTVGLNKHSSEKPIDDSFVDFEVKNDGSFVEYALELNRVFDQLLKK